LVLDLRSGGCWLRFRWLRCLSLRLRYGIGVIRICTSMIGQPQKLFKIAEVEGYTSCSSCCNDTTTSSQKCYNTPSTLFTIFFCCCPKITFYTRRNNGFSYPIIRSSHTQRLTRSRNWCRLSILYGFLTLLIVGKRAIPFLRPWLRPP